MALTQRPFDIIAGYTDASLLFLDPNYSGATGFTGKFVAEYLALKGPKVPKPSILSTIHNNNSFSNSLHLQDLKFAIAGRSQAKLEQVRANIAELDPTAANIPILIADASDIASLEAVVSQAKVVITTVGPFMQYGTALVDACVRKGTDYIDSTGETPFVKKIINLYHDAATENNVAIVPSCGFDSIPSDLGAFMVAEHFAKKGLKTKEIRYTCHDFVGGASGGTVHSGMGVLELPFKELIALRKSNYLLPAGVEGQKGPTSISTMRYEKATKRWQTYFFMEFTNTRYVARSWALFKKAYGENFNYSETMAASNIFTAMGMVAAIAIAFTFVLLPPVRWIVKKVVPQGTGPSEAEMKKGFFDIKLVGTAEDGSQCVGTFHCQADPGYRGTAILLSESALCLALQRDTLNKVEGPFKPLRGGVITAATAMGATLVDRFRKIGLTLKVEDI
ncbi:hypothetical protein HDU97_009366 [Phlyctochytrium planicorne]|nr:hypothetical protein HDU97_009366 [Phlyctochytrium planicorne]